MLCRHLHISLEQCCEFGIDMLRKLEKKVWRGFGWTIGLPFMVMSSILPIIVRDELTIKWTSPILQRIAKALLPNEVQFELVEKTPVDDCQEPTKSGSASGSTEQQEI
jgi:hypothetical protein